MKKVSSNDAIQLLDEKGRLLRSFWSSEEQSEYNRERVSCIRCREWELYQLLGKNYVFRLLFGHAGGIGFCRAVFTDLKTGEYSISGPMKLFSGDGFFLEYGVMQNHHFFRDEAGFFLTLDYDGQFYRLRCHAEKYDVELMLPVMGDALISAAPYRNRRQFFYAGRRIFSELRGSVRFLGRSYSLQNAFVSAESCRAVLPRKSARVYCSAGQSVDGHTLSLLFGWGFGSALAGLENAAFLDGKLIKLNRVREERKGSFMSPSRFFTEDGVVELCFTPRRDELFAKDYRLVYLRSHCTVGTLSGSLKLPGEEAMQITAMPVLCEHSRFCF